METRVAEVGDGAYQLMTYLDEMDFAVTSTCSPATNRSCSTPECVACSRKSPAPSSA